MSATANNAPDADALAAWRKWATKVLSARGLDPAKWGDEVRRRMIERALDAAAEPEAKPSWIARCQRCPNAVLNAGDTCDACDGTKAEPEAKVGFVRCTACGTAMRALGSESRCLACTADDCFAASDPRTQR